MPPDCIITIIIPGNASFVIIAVIIANIATTSEAKCLLAIPFSV
ncbi:MAG: hypothetical protein ACTHJ7_06745 [Candidatus Nitrosocosmicus sp.]